MPVYEYFCPRCSRELEVLRPMDSASEYSECPDCGGRAWRLISGFGSKTGSYLQPARAPFREEAALGAWRGGTVVAVSESEARSAAKTEEEQASLAVEMSWLLEAQPNGSNIWFIPDWGIASILRYLREDSDVKPEEQPPCPSEMAQAGPEEAQLPSAPAVVQDEGISNATSLPEAPPVEPPVTSAPPPASPPTAARAEPRRVARTPPLVGMAEPARRTLGRPTRRWTPVSYFGWFVLLLICTAVIVVPIVWLLTVLT
ncbi:MAG: zinc ribbon domain-containing protein [Dehalococcoidia bacterium]|nr:zinc ribbon domain-containing protein [Dehalococcoidia bacterium]